MRLMLLPSGTLLWMRFVVVGDDAADVGDSDVFTVDGVVGGKWCCCQMCHGASVPRSQYTPGKYTPWSLYPGADVHLCH